MKEHNNYKKEHENDQKNDQQVDKNSQNECKGDIEVEPNKELRDEEEILNLKNEIKSLTDKLYRANADFENIKKRLEKEKDSAVAYANEKFAADMLAVLDALEEADKIDVSENELAMKMQEGIKHCISMVIKCFEKHGISVIKTDEGFNPEFHNAIQMVEVEGKNSGEITQVYQKGYLYKGRVLRPSMVVVAK